MSQQIFQLIPKVMSDVGAIEKGRRNEAQKFFFRGIDDVMSAFQPVLAKHQVFYVPEVIEKTTDERQTKSGGTMIYTGLTVAYTFFAPDGSSVRAVVVGEAMDSGDKSSNKAMSAALKYALLQIFCVPTEANEDADAHSHEVAPRQASTAKPKLAAAPPQPNGAMTPRDAMLAEIREMVEGYADQTQIVEQLNRQLKAFNVSRVSELTDAQLPKLKDGLTVFISRQAA